MKKKCFKLVYISVILIFCQSINLYSQDEKLISSKKLLKDFDQLEKIIEAHPDPYTHISEKDFKAKFENVKSTLIHPHTKLEFCKKVALIVALIKDGHSSVSLQEFWFTSKRKKVAVFPMKYILLMIMNYMY